MSSHLKAQSQTQDLAASVADLEHRVAALEKAAERAYPRNTLKESVKSFMLEHFNISFIRDDIEEDIYDVLIDGLLDLIK